MTLLHGEERSDAFFTTMTIYRCLSRAASPIVGAIIFLLSVVVARTLTQLPIVILLLKIIVAEAATPQTQNSSITYSGIHLTAEVWHARTITNISWDIPASVTDAYNTLVVVSWDEEATDLWRFGDENDTSRADTPPSWTDWSSSYLPRPTSDEPISDDDFEYETCAFWEYVYAASSEGTFYTEENQARVTANLSDSNQSWWYTASLGHGAPINATTSGTSTTGNVSVLLSEPGVYTVCLFIVNDTCDFEECVEVTVVQPDLDFVEVRAEYDTCTSMLIFPGCTLTVEAGSCWKHAVDIEKLRTCATRTTVRTI